VLDAIVAAAVVHELWAELLPLVPLLGEAARRRVTAQVPEQELHRLEQLLGPLGEARA
jgi:hypothetical protein